MLHRPMASNRRILITAGPTQEPIDEVRFIGNRSSGRLGIALADAAAGRGWEVVLLLGATPLECRSPQVKIRRFRTTADLKRLLDEEFPRCDTLVMAAAVADYRPVRHEGPTPAKIRRGEGRLTLELEATPDLLAECAASRRPGQVLIGFALEPADRLLSSALEKVARKGLDAIVANPLATMDSPRIEAMLITRSGRRDSTPGLLNKSAFARWLLDRVEEIAPSEPRP